MGNIQSAVKNFLRFLKWPVLILLILVGLFAASYVISMHNMQVRQISKISNHIDRGELSEIIHLVNKDMIITQGLLLFSFIISVCCLLLIIIFLYISLLNTPKKVKLKNNPAHSVGAKERAAQTKRNGQQQANC